MLQVEKRYNYTTPKTFLELIKLYKSVLARKRNQVQEAIDRLDTVRLDACTCLARIRLYLFVRIHESYIVEDV